MQKLTRNYEGRIWDVEIEYAKGLPHGEALNVIKAYRAFIHHRLIPPDNLLHAIEGYFTEYIESGGRKTLDEAFGLKGKRGIGHPLAGRKTKDWNDAICFVAWHDIQAGSHQVIEDAIASVIKEFSLPFQADSVARHNRKHELFKNFDDLSSKLGFDSEFMEIILTESIKRLQVID